MLHFELTVSVIPAAKLFFRLVNFTKFNQITKLGLFCILILINFSKRKLNKMIFRNIYKKSNLIARLLNQKKILLYFFSTVFKV